MRSQVCARSCGWHASAFAQIIHELCIGEQIASSTSNGCDQCGQFLKRDRLELPMRQLGRSRRVFTVHLHELRNSRCVDDVGDTVEEGLERCGEKISLCFAQCSSTSVAHAEEKELGQNLHGHC